MRVLVTWGSKLGGTEGIARIIGEELQRQGFDARLEPCNGRHDLDGYQAVVVGGGLYANRWQKGARRFVTRNMAALRGVPVWMFSSGPLDDSADREAIAPTAEVAVLMERTGALGHATFGGRLPADAKGFPAEAMARTRAGDWRNRERIVQWAADIARALPQARPGPAKEPAGRSLSRLLAYGAVGWAFAALIKALLLVSSLPVWLALTLNAIAAPLIFIAIALGYFSARGPRAPVPVALVFVVMVAVLDAVIVAWLARGSFAMFASVARTWLPYALIFLATWATGAIKAMMPAPGSPMAREMRRKRDASARTAS